MLAGHGYFLEEEVLCGHGDHEADLARRRIDECMTLESAVTKRGRYPDLHEEKAAGEREEPAGG
jgi:hypothetical protein